MLQFKVPENKYVLSLDSLDLNFLSQYVLKPCDEERLLWSKSVEEDSAFYQVEIVSEEEVEQDEDAFIEPCESYPCYICNIDVPKKYYRQHNKSAKHQDYKKLVEKVLENVRKQINTDIDSVPNSQEYDMFYCETCCKVVTQTNKRNHNKSNYHMQSIENEQFTSKFIEMYINRNNNEDEIQSEINYENDLDSEFSSPSDSAWCHDTISKNNKNSNVPYEGNNCIGIEEIENFQKYLKDMVVKYNLDIKLPAVSAESVVIITPKGHKELITIDAFHSYEKMNGFVFCLSCVKWVQENAKEHSESEEHVRNIFQPINDNFAREVVNDKQYSHCLICNERYLTTSNHVSVKPKHKKYLHQSALKSKECDTNPDSFSEMKSDSISFEEPSTSCLSKSAVDSSLPNTDLETVEKKLKEYRKQFTLVDATTLKCLVCPNSKSNNSNNNNIIAHVEGKLHSKTCAELLLKNYLIQATLSLYYCNLCNEFTDDFLNHIKSHDKSKEYSSSSNKEISASNLSTSAIDSSIPNTELRTDEEKLKEYIKQFSVVNASHLKCLVCPNAIVPYVGNNIISHVEGRFHSEGYTDFLLKNYLTKKSWSVYYCSLCNNSTDDFVKHIKSHDKSKKCSSASNKQTSASNLSTSGIDASLPNIYLGTVEEKVNEYLKQFTVENANVLKCLLCFNCNVPYSDNNIITHVEGRPHSQARANFLLKNSLTQRSLSVYYCNLCKKSTDDFVNHIKTHVKHIPVPIKDIGGKKNKLKKFVYEDPLNESPEAIQCRKKYKDCLQKNQIVQTSDKCFTCNVCLLTMCRISEIDHMFGIRHGLAISSTSNAS